MKTVFVVDNIQDLNLKIETIKSNFGSDILFVCNTKFKKIFETYGHTANAIYTRNLSKVVHVLLSKTTTDDVIVYYSSLKLTNALIRKFLNAIGNKTKVVNVVPTYNAFEKFGNSIYNIYVKSLFKTQDSLASPKLQFLPASFVAELLESHFANRMFELNQKFVTNVYIEDKNTNENLKIKSKFNKYHLIPIIVALFLTIGLILGIAFIKVKYLLVLIFVFLYILDIVLATIFGCKAKFDSRFLKWST